MPLSVPVPEKPSLLGLMPDELDAMVGQWGWAKFRAQQVRDWVYRKQRANPAEMTNLSKRDQALLAERVSFANADVSNHQCSQDGTQKLLLRWPDGALAETVMIPDGERRTAWVSSQVGCPVGCTFCASGVGGVEGCL